MLNAGGHLPSALLRLARRTDAVELAADASALQLLRQDLSLFTSLAQNGETALLRGDHGSTSAPSAGAFVKLCESANVSIVLSPNKEASKGG